MKINQNKYQTDYSLQSYGKFVVHKNETRKNDLYGARCLYKLYKLRHRSRVVRKKMKHTFGAEMKDFFSCGVKTNFGHSNFRRRGV